MKFNINRKKLRFGGVSLALTAFVIAAVVLLNVLFTSLATNLRWYVDMTSEALFTLSAECKTLINDAILGEDGVNAERAKYNKDNGLKPEDKDYKEEAKVTIYFCDDPDNLKGDYYMRFVYTTALDLSSEFDFIDIDYYNVVYKPTELHKYQKTGNSVTSSSIIVESGTEYRIFDVASMFTMDNGEPWAYNGEKKLAGAILAVTAAEQPIAYITTSHSEGYYDSALFELLEDAGYNVRIDGAEYYDSEGNLYKVPALNDKTKNPLDDEDVRLVVVYNPTYDFQTDGVNELDRLNKFLEQNNSLMVFMGPTSNVLPVFEEWLADKWGVVFDRYKSGNDIFSYMINDTSASLDSAGYAIKADYVTGGGLGAAIYSQMRNRGYSPSVYFENAMSISYASHFNLVQSTNDDDQSRDYWYGSSWNDGTSKNIFDVFNAGLSATAIANGTTVAAGSSANSSAGSMFIFRDVDGKVYSLNKAGDKILDESGNELAYNENGKLVTAAGTELTIDKNSGQIVAVGNTEGVSSGKIVTEIIEFNGSRYGLSSDGASIVDASGKALPSETVDGVLQFKTPAGSVLTVESVAGKASIRVTKSADNTSNPFHLMTITNRPKSEQETNYTSTTLDAYVLACGSLEFATEKYLSSAVYGNADVLLSATTIMGRDVVPVGLDFKPFSSFEISDITDAEADRYTLLLTILPPVIILGAGIVVLVRRKYS